MVDQRSWYYTFPLYYKYCNQAYLNKNGEAVFMASKPAPPATIPEVTKPKERPTLSEIQEFELVKSPKECGEFKTLKRDRCMTYLNTK